MFPIMEKYKHDFPTVMGVDDRRLGTQKADTAKNTTDTLVS